MERTSHSGFSLTELLVAAALMIGVAAGVFTALVWAQSAFVVQPEAADLQQRLRVAVDTLTRDLTAAGTVAPYRVGDVGSDARAGRFYRPDAVSVAYARPNVAEIVRHTYYLKADPAADVFQLMHYDGRETDLPVIDNVSTLRFEYFGDPRPPELVVHDDGRLTTTYGPIPPPPGRDDPTDAWGPGENCTFAMVDGAPAARLPPLAVDPLPLRLAPELLTDGPWCPDGAHEERFDADLLRIRRVRVALRVQAPRSFRGASGLLFLHAGTAATAARYVPDQVVEFDVAPRGLNLGE